MMKPSRYQNRLLCAQSAFGGRGGTWKGFFGMWTSQTVQQMMLEMLGNPKESKGSGDGSIIICMDLFLISKEWAFLKDEHAPLCCLLLGLECRRVFNHKCGCAWQMMYICCFRNLGRPIARQKRSCTCWTISGWTKDKRMENYFWNLQQASLWVSIKFEVCEIRCVRFWVIWITKMLAYRRAVQRVFTVGFGGNCLVMATQNEVKIGGSSSAIRPPEWGETSSIIGCFRIQVQFHSDSMSMQYQSVVLHGFVLFIEVGRDDSEYLSWRKISFRVFALRFLGDFNHLLY